MDTQNLTFNTSQFINATNDTWPYTCVPTSPDTDDKIQFIPVIVWGICCILTVLFVPIIYRYFCCCAYNTSSNNSCVPSTEVDTDKLKNFKEYRLLSPKTDDTNNTCFKRINYGNVFDVILKSISLSGMASALCCSILLLTYYDPCTYQNKHYGKVIHKNDKNSDMDGGVGIYFWEIYLFGVLAYVLIWYLEIHFMLRNSGLCEQFIWYTVKTIYSLLIGACFLPIIYLGDSLKHSNTIQSNCICLGDQNAFIVIFYNLVAMFVMIFLLFVKLCGAGVEEMRNTGCYLCICCCSSVWLIFAGMALYYRFEIFVEQVHDFGKYIEYLSSFTVGELIFVWFMFIAIIFIVKEIWRVCTRESTPINEEDNVAPINNNYGMLMDDLEDGDVDVSNVLNDSLNEGVINNANYVDLRQDHKSNLVVTHMEPNLNYW